MNGPWCVPSIVASPKPLNASLPTAVVVPPGPQGTKSLQGTAPNVVVSSGADPLNVNPRSPDKEKNADSKSENLKPLMSTVPEISVIGSADAARVNTSRKRIDAGRALGMSIGCASLGTRPS